MRHCHFLPWNVPVSGFSLLPPSKRDLRASFNRYFHIDARVFTWSERADCAGTNSR
jgi:hypothetical protein